VYIWTVSTENSETLSFSRRNKVKPKKWKEDFGQTGKKKDVEEVRIKTRQTVCI